MKKWKQTDPFILRLCNVLNELKLDNVLLTKVSETALVGHVGVLMLQYTTRSRDCEKKSLQRSEKVRKSLSKGELLTSSCSLPLYQPPLFVDEQNPSLQLLKPLK